MNIQPSSGEINAAELVSVMELKTPVVLPRTSLIQKWRVIMKNIVLASLLGFGALLNNRESCCFGAPALVKDACHYCE